MANLVQPKDFAVERWMHLPQGGAADMFIFSGYARFGEPHEPLVGTGDTDTSEQATYVEYEVTNMLVGPHWLRVRSVCPIVVAAGLHQDNPDEADDMGFEVTGIKDINTEELPGSSPLARRIELEVKLKVRGGKDARIPSLAYQVTAFGVLHPDIGDEGLFYPQP